MPIVCIVRPNRSERRIWTPRAVARVARYASQDLGAASPIAASVIHCLGFGPAIECCAATSLGIEVVQGAVSLAKSFRTLRRAIDAYLRIEARLPRFVRRLLAGITSLLVAIREAVRLIERLADPLDTVGECDEHRDELSSLAEQLRILRESSREVTCDGPEFPGEATSGEEA